MAETANPAGIPPESACEKGLTHERQHYFRGHCGSLAQLPQIQRARYLLRNGIHHDPLSLRRLAPRQECSLT